MKAIRLHRHGGPDALIYEDVDIGQPGPGEVRVRNRAIGVNFVDIYLRTGDDASANLPFTLGKEGAGALDSTGKG
jgi:NADPH2:quinone reductase